MTTTHDHDAAAANPGGGSVGAGPVEDNSHAGQGSVMLDIGGEFGALVLHATAAMEGVEIEIRPTGSTPFADGSPNDGSAADTVPGHDGEHPHDHHDHHHHDEHEHAHDHPHDGPGWSGGHHLVHVAVLKRPSPDGEHYAAVYPELHEGTYELYERPAEPVALRVTIAGGAVTEASWPTS